MGRTFGHLQIQTDVIPSECEGPFGLAQGRPALPVRLETASAGSSGRPTGPRNDIERGDFREHQFAGSVRDGARQNWCSFPGANSPDFLNPLLEFVELNRLKGIRAIGFP